MLNQFVSLHMLIKGYSNLQEFRRGNTVHDLSPAGSIAMPDIGGATTPGEIVTSQ